MKAYEELERKGIVECAECHCAVGEDWDYVDFSNKTTVECPQCKTRLYIEDLMVKEK